MLTGEYILKKCIQTTAWWYHYKLLPIISFRGPSLAAVRLWLDVFNVWSLQAISIIINSSIHTATCRSIISIMQINTSQWLSAGHMWLLLHILHHRSARGPIRKKHRFICAIVRTADFGLFTRTSIRWRYITLITYSSLQCFVELLLSSHFYISPCLALSSAVTHYYRPTAISFALYSSSSLNPYFFIPFFPSLPLSFASIYFPSTIRESTLVNASCVCLFDRKTIHWYVLNALPFDIWPTE